MSFVAAWTDARDILAVRLDAMGDLLMTTPALRALKERPQTRRLTLLTSPQGAKVARTLPFVDDVIAFTAPWTKCGEREPASADRIVGWFQGRMEFGPRALGARSILASPVHAGMQARLNELKDRENFRPVAPAVLEDVAGEWFDGCTRSPFMLFVFDVPAARRAAIPSACHADGTARVQTVSRTHNPVYYDTIAAFSELSGVPIVINTSFNTRGKPIVCTPRDALECFFTSPLDVLAIGPYVVEKRAA